MTTKRLLIVYYTGRGSTGRMAEEISKGAGRSGVKVEMRRVEECKLSDLAEADGIVMGSPTYFSSVAWPVKKLIDESITLYSEGRPLKNKVGGRFTSADTRRGGKDCIRMMDLAFGLHHKLKMMPGVIRVSGDDEEAVSQRCQHYGIEIAGRILL